MKKLVSVDEVKAAADNGQKVICIDAKTLITPAAKDLARELGVEFSADTSAAVNHMCQDSDLKNCQNTGHKDCQESVQKCPDNQEKAIDRDLIVQIVKAVLANNLLASVPAPAPEEPFVANCEPKSGLKIVRGRTVKYENFDTGIPSNNVAYREVISKDDSQMSAGFLTLEKSSFDWELCYEEIDIILEGSLSITINGETYHAHQGDVLFVPKGSKVTWSSSEYVKLFYVTYPANWADLMAQQ